MFIPLMCLSILGLGCARGHKILDMANTGFAIDLYKKLGNENQGKNLFFSPISISIAFGMVNLGARGNTQTQMKTVFHLNNINSTDTDINEAFRQLLESFKIQNNNYTLHAANRLFGRRHYKFRQTFLEESEKYFQTTLEGLDFRGNADGCRRHINDWVANETNQKIKDLLPDGCINYATTLVIVNAIYFQAFWEIPFIKEYTKEESFRISRTETAPIDMMKTDKERLGYYNSDDLECEVVELLYHGAKASMLILLPRDVEGLARVEEKLSADGLSQIMNKIEMKLVHLQFPKFTIDQDICLKKFLQSMGLLDLFDGNKCDLSGITDDDKLVVGDAVHKAYVKVTEFGNEAAGATAIGFGVTSYEPTIPVIVDRPFLFFILEKNTGSVLFMGRVVRPPVGRERIGKFGDSTSVRSGLPQLCGHISLMLSAVVIALTNLLL